MGLHIDLVHLIVTSWVLLVQYSQTSHSAGRVAEMQGAEKGRDTGNFLE
jgi:hypothetical protein